MQNKLFWVAKKQDGEIVVLTEKEALTHFERNNISTRMRLQFLGTTSGEHTANAQQKIKDIIKAGRPDNYHLMEDGDRNLADHRTRIEHSQEIKELLDEALQKDVEDAKKSGVKQPRKDLRIHTRSTDGHSRNQILQAMGGMI